MTDRQKNYLQKLLEEDYSVLSSSSKDAVAEYLKLKGKSMDELDNKDASILIELLASAKKYTKALSILE